MWNLARTLGIDGWITKLIEAVRVGDWTKANTFARTIGSTLRGKTKELVRMVEKLRDMSKLLRDAGASAEDIEAFEAVIASLEEAAAEVVTAGETAAAGLSIEAMLIGIAVAVVFIWLCSGSAHADEMPKSQRKKMPSNSTFDPLGELSKARKNLVNHKRKACACSRKVRHALPLHANFPTGAGMNNIRFGGATSMHGPAGQSGSTIQGASGKAGGQGASGKSGAQRPSGKPADGGGGRPDPFSFPKPGGPPMSPPGTKGPAGPTMPDARPQGVCLWPLCQKIRSSFG